MALCGASVALLVEVGKFAVSSELGGRWSDFAMGLHAFSSRGLSWARALLRRRRPCERYFFTGTSESLPLEVWERDKNTSQHIQIPCNVQDYTCTCMS